MKPRLGRTVSFRVSGLALLAALAAGPAGADVLCNPLADEFAAAAAGLEREWLLQLPFATPTSPLEKVVVGDGLVIAQTGDGTLHAIQATAGQPGEPAAGALLWTHTVAGSHGSSPAAIGRDIVAVPHDEGVLALERASGRTAWDERFGMPTGSPAVVGGWVYVPTVSGIRRLPVNPLRLVETVAEAAARSRKEAPDAKGRKPAGKGGRKKPATGAAKGSNESLDPITLDAGGDVTQAPQPFAGGVLWCTRDGALVALVPRDFGWERLEYLLDRPPAGRPLVQDDAIFAATAEGDLVRIDAVGSAQGGGLRLTWRVLLDGVPDPEMFLSGDSLVVSLGVEGIAVYSTKTGELLGRTWRSGRIVAVTGGRIWLFDAAAGLTSIDLATGEVRDRFCLGGFTFPVVNHGSDRLILATPGGVLVSLKPCAEQDAASAEAAATGKAEPAVPAEDAAADRPADDPAR